MSDNYFSDKRVVLLGGASLIGAHLAKALLDRGTLSVGVVDDLSSGKISNVKELRHRYESGFWFHRLDLRDYQGTLDMVSDENIVFHLAAQHGGRGYVASHATELYNNLELDTTIFRACAKAGVQKVIFSSSACAYPIDLQTNSDELVYLSEDLIDYNNVRQADGPYGMEKLLGEMILDAHIEKGDFQGCSTRSFTVYGPLMGETHAIAALIAKVMIRQNPIEVWGSGSQVRNWTAVWDNVQGALLAAEYLERGAINIGVEDRLTPIKAVNKICEIMDWWPDSVLYQRDKPVGPMNRVADATKLKSLGWEPKYTFEEGLRETIEWYVSTHDAEQLKKDFEKRLTER